MTRKQMENKINNIFDIIQATREAGQLEYARDKNDAFANFDRVAKQLDTSQEKVLLTYFLKHIDGISAFCNGHKSQREDVRGRITDAIVYLCLLWGMIDVNEEKEKSNKRIKRVPTEKV